MEKTKKQIIYAYLIGVDIIGQPLYVYHYL